MFDRITGSNYIVPVYNIISCSFYYLRCVVYMYLNLVLALLVLALLPLGMTSLDVFLSLLVLVI